MPNPGTLQPRRNCHLKSSIKSQKSMLFVLDRTRHCPSRDTSPPFNRLSLRLLPFQLITQGSSSLSLQLPILPTLPMLKLHQKQSAHPVSRCGLYHPTWMASECTRLLSGLKGPQLLPTLASLDMRILSPKPQIRLHLNC